MKRTALKRGTSVLKRSTLKKTVGMTKAKKAHKKVKKESVNAWKKKVWTVFSKWIRERDDYTCYTCGRQLFGSSMHAGHFISRRNNATFFDEMNVHAQCMFDNMYNYGDTGRYAERLISDYGLDAFQSLLARSRGSKQFTIPELKSLYSRYAQDENDESGIL